MSDEFNESYRVVLNGEEQYSVWPASRAIPSGWRDAGFTGTRSNCLDFIKKTWTDPRPLSLREAMGNSAPPANNESPAAKKAPAAEKAPAAKKTTAAKTSVAKTPAVKKKTAKKSTSKKTPAKKAPPAKAPAAKKKAGKKAGK